MKNIFRKRSKKSGLPPGSLVHIGEQRTEKVRIKVIDYNEQQITEKEFESAEDVIPFFKNENVTWIDVEGLHQTDIIEKFGNQLGVHPLVMEDILNTDQRPKLEDFDDYIFIVVKMFHTHDSSNIHSEQVSFLLCKNILISFQEGIEGDTFSMVRERLRANKGKIRKSGTDFLVYSLIDSIVDNYFNVLEIYGEKIETLEEDLIANPERHILNNIYGLKREMLILRKSVWPLRELLLALQRGDTDLLSSATIPYFRDIYDHTIHIIDTTETFRDMLAGMLDIYLSSISNKINEVMKVLTIITTIFIPLSFIAGLYGMNFNTGSPLNMPELNWQYGYPTVVFVMIVLALSLLLYFKKKKWL